VFEQGGEFPAYGADAVRFGLLAMSSSQDVRFNEDKVAQGRQLANKLWNASRLVLLRVPEGVAVPEAPAPQEVEDAWILSRLQAAKREVARAIDAFEFHHAALGLYDFVYGDLCDWYLEMIKPRLYADDNRAVCEFSLHVLAETLALAHPIIPFVTEEIWSQFGDGLLAQGAFPQAGGERDPEAEAALEAAIGQVRQFRAWRDEMNVRPGAVLPARYEGLELVARLARIEPGEGEVVARVGDIEVLASEHVDLEAGARRVAERRAKLENEIKRVQGKLANEKFVANAPPEIVAREREKLEAFESELASL